MGRDGFEPPISGLKDANAICWLSSARIATTLDPRLVRGSRRSGAVIRTWLLVDLQGIYPTI